MSTAPDARQARCGPRAGALRRVALVPPSRESRSRSGQLTGYGGARQLGVGFVKIREEYEATMLAKLEDVHEDASTPAATKTIRPTHSRPE